VKVKLVFWRGRTPYKIEVLPGLMGMDTNEYNPVGYQLDAVLKHAEVMDHIPEYQRAVEFKAELDKESIDAISRSAKELIDRAEADGSLTATQILVARIRSILDNAPEEELKRQDVLIAEFLRSQPAEYIGYLGGKFEEQDHFRPARALLKQYLLIDPDSVPTRINLGYVNTKLGLWADVEAGADLLLTNPEDLVPHELYTVNQQKALGALSRSDYDTAITFAEKAFAHEGDFFDIGLIQLAAALKGDVDKVREAFRTFQQKRPKDFEAFKFQVDSAEALALAVGGQDELARAVIARWAKKDRTEGRLKDCWRHYPQGSKAVENWMRLSQK
jgi:tetratricopeptide (TPR) repeat protein